MTDFLIYLSGVIAAFIMNVITFRFTRFKLTKADIEALSPVLIFLWFVSWIGAATMLIILTIDIIAHSSLIGKLYTKLTNSFIKLTGK